MKWPTLLLAALLCASVSAPADETKEDRNVVVVMIDGLRWQEVFRGADSSIVSSHDAMESPLANNVNNQFVNVADRRNALMPFVAGEIASRGVLIGDRDRGSCAKVSNDFWISYPGYSEALVGVGDPSVDSNDMGPNPNITFLEWLNRRASYTGHVEAVASWDAFLRIINVDRSGIPINAGQMQTGRASASMTMLDRLIKTTPTRKLSRYDAFTHEIAMETLRADHPRVLFIQYEQPDTFAHDGDYSQYLLSVHRVDLFLKDLWAFIAHDAHYAGRTTLLVTVDHGRGNRSFDSWRNHGSFQTLKSTEVRARYPSGFLGSNEIWIGAIGPDIVQSRQPGTVQCATLSQVAATALTALGENWHDFNPHAAPPLDIFKKPAQ